MSEQFKIENEVAELKNLLNIAENRLRQLEIEQAELKLKQSGTLLKKVKKTLIAIGLSVIALQGAKIIYRHKKRKNLLSEVQNLS